MGREDVAPLGSIYSRDGCYLCGARGTHQKKVVVKVTRAQALACVDVVACLRRKRRAEDAAQEKLFMRNPRPAA